MTESGQQMKRFRIRIRYENVTELLMINQLHELDFDKAYDKAVQIGRIKDAGKITEIRILFKGG